MAGECTVGAQFFLIHVKEECQDYITAAACLLLQTEEQCPHQAYLVPTHWKTFLKNASVRIPNKKKKCLNIVLLSQFLVHPQQLFYMIFAGL